MWVLGIQPDPLQEQQMLLVALIRKNSIFINSFKILYIYSKYFDPILPPLFLSDSPQDLRLPSL